MNYYPNPNQPGSEPPDDEQPTQPYSPQDDHPTMPYQPQAYPPQAYPPQQADPRQGYGQQGYPPPYAQQNYPQQPYQQPYPPQNPYATQPVQTPLPQQPYGIEQAQRVRVGHAVPPRARRGGRGCLRLGCFQVGCLGVLGILALLLVYFLAPLRTNFLILGIDRTPEGSAVGRSDTMILVSVDPLAPRVEMLSIPRDLWVTVPGVGEQRINTAHFFAEAQQAGSGPAAALETVKGNFGVDVPYFVRVRFDTFSRIIDAFGGIDITLSEPMSGYEAGTHHLNSEQALAFARDRKGSDDFFRMGRGQIVIRAVLKQALSPATWGRLPDVARAMFETVDTNLPLWQMPRLGLALARATVTGIDSRTVDRDMVTPYTTDQGASVLLPNWDAINPVTREMFGP